MLAERCQLVVVRQRAQALQVGDGPRHRLRRRRLQRARQEARNTARHALQLDLQAEALQGHALNLRRRVLSEPRKYGAAEQSPANARLRAPRAAAPLPRAGAAHPPAMRHGMPRNSSHAAGLITAALTARCTAVYGRPFAGSRHRCGAHPSMRSCMRVMAS